MEPILDYLKNAFRQLKQESRVNPPLLCIVVLLWSIPMDYAFNSVALGVLMGITLIFFKKTNFKTEPALLLPMALYALMALSLFWTIDTGASLKALSKGIPLLLIPLCFLMFAAFTQLQKRIILQWYSFGMLAFTIFYLCKALCRFAVDTNPAVFFYHELVTEDVNAIHVSVYVSVAAIYFITATPKVLLHKIGVLLLMVFLMLLSSKNIIIVSLLLLFAHFIKKFKTITQKGMVKYMAIIFILFALVFFGKVKERFSIELQSNVEENTINTEISKADAKVYNVSIQQAWKNKTFKGNDYFPGTAFRVYQFRIFIEMLQENPILFTGFGLNAADAKIVQKGDEHQVHEIYKEKNFHNEYIQIFAELGVFALLLLVAMLGINIKYAISSKDFVHISFAILMISLFLTESFLSRQRGLVFFTIMYCLFMSRNAVTQRNEIINPH